MKSIKKYLVSKYVKFCLFWVGLLVRPMNRFVRHLISVQGLDPNSDPKAMSFELLKDNITKCFVDRAVDVRDFEENFDPFAVVLSRAANSGFSAVLDEKPDLNLCEKDFVALTDVSNLDNGSKDLVKLSTEEILSRIDNNELVKVFEEIMSNPVIADKDLLNFSEKFGEAVDEVKSTKPKPIKKAKLKKKSSKTVSKKKRSSKK